MSYIYRTLIVPASLAEQVRGLCMALAGDAAAGMFTTALSASGAEPATHFISTGAIGAEFASALLDPEVMYSACQKASVSISLQECKDILSSAEVIDLKVEDVRRTLERIGQVQISSFPQQE